MNPRVITVGAVLLVSRASFAQEAGEPPVPPPTVIAPVETIITVRPVTVDLLQVLGSGVASPQQIRAVVARMSVHGLCAVVIALADNPKALSLVLAQMDSGKLVAVVSGLVKTADLKVVSKIIKSNPRLEITLFAFDLSRWMAVRELIQDGTTYEGNWLGAACKRLRARIAREGYSDGVMADFQQIKSRRAKPNPSTLNLAAPHDR